MITHIRLLEILKYDPETGVWMNRVCRGSRAAAGAVAGTVHTPKRSKPFRRINIDGKWHSSNRLAWFYMTKQWPLGEVDHIDRNSLNDRWVNLRDVSRYANEANKGAYKNNRSGHKGVRLNSRGRYDATIMRRGRRTYLGTFETALAAAAAYEIAAQSEAA